MCNLLILEVYRHKSTSNTLWCHGVTYASDQEIGKLQRLLILGHALIFFHYSAGPQLLERYLQAENRQKYGRPFTA